MASKATAITERLSAILFARECTKCNRHKADELDPPSSVPPLCSTTLACPTRLFSQSATCSSFALQSTSRRVKNSFCPTTVPALAHTTAVFRRLKGLVSRAIAYSARMRARMDSPLFASVTAYTRRTQNQRASFKCVMYDAFSLISSA